MAEKKVFRVRLQEMSVGYLDVEAETGAAAILAAEGAIASDERSVEVDNFDADATQWSGISAFEISREDAKLD